MRLIRWTAAILGCFIILPEKSKAIVFCLFIILIVGMSFLILGMIVAILRMKDKIDNKRFARNPRAKGL